MYINTQYWSLGIIGYLCVGIALLLVGPASRVIDFDVRSAQKRNKAVPHWKLSAFAGTLRTFFVLLWPVFYPIMRSHVRAVGQPPDVELAVSLACDELLGNSVPKEKAKEIAHDLAYGGGRYSTHDLATAVALNLYRNAMEGDLSKLVVVQVAARLKVLEWTEQGKVKRFLADAFEQSLYKLFAPLVASTSPSKGE